MLKVNRHNKTNDRFLIFSETHFYKLDPGKGKLMRGEELRDLAGLSVGQGSHQLVVLHMRDKKDLVMSLETPQGEDRVGELVAVLALAKQ